MQIYLPIAEMSVNIFVILAMGGGVGLLSGLFGVGGGFLMTPLLIFVGVPPAVAVGTQSNQIVASSVSGVLAHMRRGNVDFKMGGVLTAGGFIGSGLGVWVFNILKRLGHIDVTIGLGYVLFLGVVGGFMLYESLPTALGRPLPSAMAFTERGPGRHTWMHGLPFKMRFRRSKLYISALLPLGVGFLVGILVATMGVGGGFLMVPAMIYLLGMPTQVVIGTSLFQIIFVTANTTLLQATFNQSVDVVLALLLLVVGVVGAQVGARLAGRFKSEQLRVMLAVMVLGVALRLAFDLVVPPADVFSLGGE
jgi:uncharacterized membrane protein YfcA